jgi:hypothetical protein
MNNAPNAFQEVLTYTFAVPVGLLDGGDTIAINNTDGDGYIIDYSKLTVTSAVPEPGSVMLLLTVVAILSAALRRKVATSR